MKERKQKIAEFIDSLNYEIGEIHVFGGSENSINGTNEYGCKNLGGACGTSINKDSCINYGTQCDKNTNWRGCMETDPVLPNLAGQCTVG